MDHLDTPYRALVLDADQRSALAVTRSLGRAGIAITVADTHQGSLSSRSRFASREGVYPDPGRDPLGFARFLAGEAGSGAGAVVIPCTDLTVPEVARGNHAGTLRSCLPPLDAYRRLSDKWRLSQLCRELGIPVPTTWRRAPGETLGDALKDLTWPAIVKPRCSVMPAALQSVRLPVMRAQDRAALDRLMAETYPTDADLLVQGAVVGDGFGISVLCDRGRPVAWFSHRRLREMPPSGGVSTYCESITLPGSLVRHCEALIAATDWHGPIMFEFKGNPGGPAWLIEVNGRVWGSMQLAVDCGVDIPVLMYRLALGEAVTPVTRYAVGRRMRWMVGDLSHLYMVLRGKRIPDPAPGRLNTLRNVLLTWDRQCRTEDWRYGDIGPFWCQLGREAGRLLRRS